MMLLMRSALSCRRPPSLSAKPRIISLCLPGPQSMDQDTTPFRHQRSLQAHRSWVRVTTRLISHRFKTTSITSKCRMPQLPPVIAIAAEVSLRSQIRDLLRVEAPRYRVCQVRLGRAATKYIRDRPLEARSTPIIAKLLS